MNLPFHDGVTARRYLADIGCGTDQAIDIFAAALALSIVHRPSIVIDKYFHHFNALIDNLNVKFEELCALENGDTVVVQAQALHNVMARKHGYIGDDRHYDDLQNVDMMRVIDRRLGMPITLCILAIAVCRSLGWRADGLNFPGHFLMRLEKDGERLILDPFQGGIALSAPDLRVIIKRNLGDGAELSGDYYHPCTNREMLLRLQNNIKYRLIDSEHYAEAIEIVDIMKLIAPDDYRLDLDMAVLLARVERPKAALSYLVRYIASVPDAGERAEAEAFLRELRGSLH